MELARRAQSLSPMSQNRTGRRKVPDIYSGSTVYRLPGHRLKDLQWPSTSSMEYSVYK